ncbi:MAG: hypothetical protein Q4A62_00675 [Eikenella sp.]|nr:hypothetical protein [Eikenella sp.]
MKKKWFIGLLTALSVFALSGCAATAGHSSPDHVRLNPMHQVGADGDVWECKRGSCQKIR